MYFLAVVHAHACSKKKKSTKHRYDACDRLALLRHLSDKASRRTPWPSKVAAAFGSQHVVKTDDDAAHDHDPTASNESDAQDDVDPAKAAVATAGVSSRSSKPPPRPPVLFGSPVVDFIQGSYKGLDQVLETKYTRRSPRVLVTPFDSRKIAHGRC